MRYERVCWADVTYAIEDGVHCDGCYMLVVGPAQEAYAPGMTHDEPDDELGIFHIGCEP